jgi:3-oxoadipate enol-lactonase
MRSPDAGFRVDGPPDAPVLVLANSLGTTTEMWVPQLPAFAKRFRVLRYDHPGHDGTPAPAGPYTVASLGAPLLDRLDDTGVEEFSFAGVSLGGMVGLWLAAHAPERVRRLVVCASSAYLPPAHAWHDRAARVRAEGTAAVAGEVVPRWFTSAFCRREPAVVASYVAALVGVDDEGYAGCCEALAALDLRDELRNIRASTLVLAGADDPATPPPHAHAIAAAVPDARLVVLPEAAHLLTVEAADRATSLLLKHLTAAVPEG